MAANALYRTRLLGGILRFQRLICSDLIILAYHRIMDIGPLESYEFDRELISATTSDFEWQMQYVAKYFTPITFGTVIECIDRGLPLPPRPVIVTFDDGFDDNAEYAFPILRRVGMPATMFVATGYIGETKTFWFDWVVYLVKAAASRGLTVGWSGDGPSLAGQATSSVLDTCNQVLEHLKGISDEVRREFVVRLEQLLAVSYPEEGYLKSRPMTPSQIRELSRGGIEFGSHSVSHPILTRVTDSLLAEEMAGARRMLADWTGAVPLVIAYPNGDRQSFDGRVIDAARNAGYRLGVSYLSGTNRWPLPTDEYYRLRRIHVELEVSRSEFAAMMAFPSIF